MSAFGGKADVITGKADIGCHRQKGSRKEPLGFYRQAGVPNDASEPLFLDMPLGRLCEQIREWYEANTGDVIY